jgi:hypothetical protein
LPGPEDFFRIVTSEALWLYLLSLSRADANTKKLHLPCAPMVSSMTRDATSSWCNRSPWPPKHRELCAGYGLPVRSDRTNFRRRGQADGQANSLGEFQVKRLFPRGNEKFIARRSHAMSATQSGCVAFNSFHLSRFAKGDYVNRLLLADSGMAGCRADVSLLLCRRRRFSPRLQSTFPLKLPSK